ncbi:hypothetical protein [Pseudothermotoga sp.]|uniref:hypothetical protein n=1 Tax=Pseudothermotoga sp. TaxID=2033661 RepID=UPI0031F699C7
MESLNVCCPYTTKTATPCGCFWWKVEACGVKDGKPATVTVVGPKHFCVVPGFVVKVTTPEGTPIESVTIMPGKETLDLLIDVCKLTDLASLVISATPTLCATTTLKVEITKDATPFFDIKDSSATDTYAATLTSATPGATYFKEESLKFNCGVLL